MEPSINSWTRVPVRCFHTTRELDNVDSLGATKNNKNPKTRPVYIKPRTCDQSTPSERSRKSVGRLKLPLSATADHAHYSITRNAQHKSCDRETWSGGSRFICRTTRSLATPATADATGKSTLSKAPIHIVGSKQHLRTSH